MHTQTSKSSNTIAALFLIITGVIGSFMGTTPQVATLSLTASSVCPSGNGWVKYDNWSDSKKSQTHVAPNGNVIVQVCVKGGNNIEYFSANGVESCWKVSGINQQTAKAEENWGHNKPHGCRDISHASFKIGTIASPTPTPRPTVTPSPTPSATPTATPTPSPTATPTPSETPEPSVTPTPSPTPSATPTATPTPSPTATPTPSETPEPDKTPRISDLFVTDPNCESNQITAAQVLKYDDKPQQNIAVVFEYQGTKKTAYTNSEGKAEVSFTYAGDGELTAKPEHGFSERKEMITKETNCSTTIASSGQVLGASTDPLIYAETGILEDTVMSIFGITGMALMAAGYVQTKKTI